MKSSTIKLIGTFGLGVVTCLGALAVRARAAGIPDADVLTYTGYLESAEGTPLDGEHSISVQFWESLAATKDLCAASLGSVELQAGRFQVPLPAECADAVKANPDLFVDVSIDGASLGRTKLGAVPYAIEAAHATKADEAEHAQSADTATNAKNALTTLLRDEISVSSEFGATCFANPTIWNCAVAADLRCQALGYVSGWVQGDWGSSGDATTRQIVCIK